VTTPLPPFYFAQSAPDRQLSPWFARYWTYQVRDGAPPTHQIPPDGSTAILFRLGGHDFPRLHVSGPWRHSRRIAVQPGERYFGIRLQPGAAWEVLGAEAGTLRERATPCDRYLGALSHRIARQLTEAENLDQAGAIFNRAFLRIADRLEMPDPFVAEAVDRIIKSRGQRPIAMILNEMHTTYSTLLRRFRDATGLTPAEFIRIQQIRYAIRIGTEVPEPPRSAQVHAVASLTGMGALRVGRGEMGR
jgi:AraC-like DNA-binding protein